MSHNHDSGHRRTAEPEPLTYKNGTVIFFNGGDYISRFIENATFSWWSHVGICINMSPSFKVAFCDAIGSFKRFEAQSVKYSGDSELPMFDEFGSVNEIGPTLEALKQHFDKVTVGKIPKFKDKTNYLETLDTLTFMPPPTEGAKTWSKAECVHHVIHQLNNAIYDANHVSDAGTKEVRMAPNNPDICHLATGALGVVKCPTSINPDLKKRLEDLEAFTGYDSDLITLSRCGEIKTQLLSFISDDQLRSMVERETTTPATTDSRKRFSTSSVEKKSRRKRDGENDGDDDNEGLLKPEYKEKIKHVKHTALLHHVIQFLEAATLLYSTNLKKKIAVELKLQDVQPSSNNNKQTTRTLREIKPIIHTYMWESTTGDDVNCMDELTEKCEQGVKLTFIPNRLKDYNKYIVCRHVLTSKQMYESHYKSYERSVSTSREGNNANEISSSSSPTMRKKSDGGLKSTTITRTMSLVKSRSTSLSPDRTVSTAHRLAKKQQQQETTTDDEDYSLYPPIKTESKVFYSLDEDKNRITANFIRTLSDRPSKLEEYGSEDDYDSKGKGRDKEGGNTTDGRLNTEYAQISAVYKGMLCNIMVNHGKSYQQGVSDFARAWFSDFCCNCFCSGGRGRDQRVDSTVDNWLNNLHEPTENDDFFCSELVYQTLMDVKLYQSLEVMNMKMVRTFEGMYDSTIPENMLRFTLSDFETPSDYYAFFAAYALLLLCRSGAWHYLYILGLTTSMSPFEDKKNASETNQSLNVTSCMITPSKLYDLDVKNAIGIVLSEPSDFYTLEETSTTLR